MLWRYLVRPLLFSIDAEPAHHFAMGGYRAVTRIPGVRSCLHALYHVKDPALHCQLWGLDFPNPIGLGAGFDKRARWFNELAALGFGHVEVGTITAHPQPGNPKPRLFRVPQDQALINRLGFNNKGCATAAENLKHQKIRTILGINIGKSKVTELDEATADYLRSFECLFDYANYFTVNVSSPNTPNLRELQDKEPLTALLSALEKKNRTKSQPKPILLKIAPNLRELQDRDRLEDLLTALQSRNQELAQAKAVSPKPILLKIAPDLTEEQLDDIAEILLDRQLSGLIATNTTIDRSGLKTPQERIEAIGAGGLSGRPLTLRSREVVRGMYRRLGGKVPIIGVGGVFSSDDAWEMMCAGASLVQVYTGFIYSGPGFVAQINRELSRRLAAEGVSHIHQIVGSAA